MNISDLKPYGTYLEWVDKAELEDLEKALPLVIVNRRKTRTYQAEQREADDGTRMFAYIDYDHQTKKGYNRSYPGSRKVMENYDGTSTGREVGIHYLLYKNGILGQNC